MRRALAVAAFLALLQPPGRVAAAPPGVERIDAGRIDRLAEWVRAVERHRPGVEDEPLETVRGWTSGDLRSLIDDAKALVILIENHRTSRFFYRTPDYRSVELGYSKPQLTRMRLLACAAGGLVTEEYCTVLRANQPVDGVLADLAGQALASRRAGDRSYFVRRAAMLHTDIATLAEPQFNQRSVNAATALRLDDGLGAPVLDPAEHWELARTMLDHVVPAGETKPAPAHDRTVREWYVATAAWLEGNARYRTDHLDRGRDLFPDDADLLFLSGCQREAYAVPAVQEAVKEARKNPFVRLPIESESRELANAERFFRHALAVKPGMNEARLHLGRVLIDQRRYEEAARELERIPAAAFDPASQYYLALFSGTAAEALGRFDEARQAYETAATLFPSAQSAYVARSELAWRRGNARAALAAFEQMLATASDDPASDPWWTYGTSEVRDPDVLLDRWRSVLARNEP